MERRDRTVLPKGTRAKTVEKARQSRVKVCTNNIAASFSFFALLISYIRSTKNAKSRRANVRFASSYNDSGI
jgi:hypothetical protein